MTDDKKSIDKWSECHEKAHAILHFLEWIRNQKGYRIQEKKTYIKDVCTNTVDVLLEGAEPEYEDVEFSDWYHKSDSDLDLVYEFFDIDPIELEMGRRKILEFFQNQNDS